MKNTILLISFLFCITVQGQGKLYVENGGYIWEYSHTNTYLSYPEFIDDSLYHQSIKPEWYYNEDGTIYADTIKIIADSLVALYEQYSAACYAYNMRLRDLWEEYRAFGDPKKIEWHIQYRTFEGFMAWLKGK